MDNQQPSTNIEWRTVIEYDRYEVNQFGDIRHKQRKKNLTPRYNRGGYGYVSFNIAGKRTNFAVHRIVANAFIPNLDNKPEVNHKDGNTKNNCVDNLEWVTSSENKYYTYIKETNHNCRGKEVFQYDQNGKYIATYPSMTAAAQVIKVGMASISACCNGSQKTSGGHIWKVGEGSTTKYERNPSSSA